MKPALKRAWVKALRSGEYEQGHGCLHHRGKWCCLGVLCNLPDTPGEWDGNTYLVDERGSATDLPSPLNIALGVTIGAENALIELNDKIKAPFDTIADWIEKNL